MSSTQQETVQASEIAELREQLSQLTQVLVHTGTINRQSVNEFLEDSDVGESAYARRKRRKSEADEADPLVQRSFRLRKSLAMRFKAKAAANGLTTQDAMNALLIAYLEDDKIIEGLRGGAAIHAD